LLQSQDENLMFTLSKTDRNNDSGICVSIGILAWNEEESIETTLNSILNQLIFKELCKRGLRSEIILVANGCSDRTAEVARGFFVRASRTYSIQPHVESATFGVHQSSGVFNFADLQGPKDSVTWRVIEVPERGKNNAWNMFVHSFSARDAACLFLVDADIVIRGDETLWNMYCTLENCPEASVAVDQPVKDIALKTQKSLGERISLATSSMTGTASAQLSGQLYAIRTSVARNILLPRDLVACEDGFIKSLVCTDFLTSSSRAERIGQAAGAAHVFQSYRRPSDLVRNQKRQMIGQTLVHLLVDKHLKDFTQEQKLSLASTLHLKETSDREWLKRLTARHLAEVKYFWRLFPNLLRFRFERWRALSPARRLSHLPATMVGFVVTLLASYLAFRFLKQGSLSYWPDTRSPGLRNLISAPSSPSERLASTITINN
jgi:glycosyltransferase involved in cell wall biosynthesis